MHARRHLPRPGHRQTGAVRESGDIRIRRLGLDDVHALRPHSRLDGLDYGIAAGRAETHHQPAGLRSELDGMRAHRIPFRDGGARGALHEPNRAAAREREQQACNSWHKQSKTTVTGSIAVHFPAILRTQPSNNADARMRTMAAKLASNSSPFRRSEPTVGGWRQELRPCMSNE